MKAVNTIQASINAMHAQKAIAEWNAAQEILTNHGQDSEAFIDAYVGHGIDKNLADHLKYLVAQLRSQS